MMSLKKRNKEIGPATSTYRVVLDKLDHQLGDSLVDRVVSKFMGALTRVYRGLRITQTRVATALDNAEIDPMNKKEREQGSSITQQMAEEGRRLRVMNNKIGAEISSLQQILADLPPEVLDEIAISEGVIPDVAEPAPEEGPDLEQQFSAGEEGAKKKQKIALQQEKQHQKEISHQAKEVIGAEKDKIKQLKEELGTDKIVAEIRKLNKDVLPELQKRARPEVEEAEKIKEIPKGEAFEQFKAQELQKRIDRAVMADDSAAATLEDEGTMGL